MPDFPHLEGATIFPFTTTPQPYEAIRGAFDYSQWSAGTTVKLLSVPWDGAANIVGWETEEARDTWFDSAEGYETVLQTPTRLHAQTLRIPLPYDMSALYNYLYVTMPEEPVTGGTGGVKTWGFFIIGYDYLAPSTTELTLQVDLLTTFYTRLTVKSVQLLQGHWAVKNSATVDDYLADPLANTANLMDSEGDDTGDARRTLRTGIEHWWNQGDQAAVLNFGLANPRDTDWTGSLPTIDGAYTRIQGQPVGYMLAVTDAADLGTFLKNAPAGVKLSIKSVWIVPSRFLVFGTAFTLYETTCAELLSTQDVPLDVQLTRSDFAYPNGATEWTKLYTGQYARVILRRSDGVSMSLPTEAIAGNAVLHARPEFTDAAATILAYLVGVGSSNQDSTSVERLSSDTAAIGGAWETTLNKWDIPAYTVRVNSVDATAWSRQYDRSNSNARALAEYQNACDSADNTYTVNTASATTGQENANASADNAFSTAKASADTSQTNTNASADNAYTTAAASATTAQTNAGASADTAKENTTRQTNNQVTNTGLQTATATANQTQNNELTEDTTNLAIAASNEANWINIDTQITRLGLQGVTRTNYSDAGSIHGESIPTGSQIGNMLANAQLDQTYTNTQYTVQREAQAQGVATTALQNAVSGFGGMTTSTTGAMTSAEKAMTEGVSASVAGATVGLAAGIAVTGFAAGLIGGAMNLNVSISKEEALQDASRIYQIGDGVAFGDGGKIGAAMQNILFQNQQERIFSRKIQTQQNTVASTQLNGGTTLSQTVRHGTLATATTVTNNNNTLATNITANNKSTSDSNATATQTTTKANAKRTYDTSVSNAAAVQSTSKANATRTHDTTVSNAESSQTTTKANAKRTYDTSVSNAAASRDVSKANALRTYNAALATTTAGINTDGRLQPVESATATATGEQWATMPVGVEIDVERPADGVLTRIADRMNRYGYICQRTISAPDLNQMDKWTYWQCAEAWVRPTTEGAPRAAVTALHDALTRGVTIWRKPDEIGDTTQ